MITMPKYEIDSERDQQHRNFLDTQRPKLQNRTFLFVVLYTSFLSHD
jgi:hypothetical protein